jgi:predicted membrane channel-forming protein YqfA (hemolysin III family)
MKKLLKELDYKLMSAPEPWGAIVFVVLGLTACFAVITIIVLAIEYNLWQIPLGITLYFIGKAFYVVFFTKN